MPRKKAEKKTPNATHKAVDEVMCAKTNTQTDENMVIISLPISNQIIEKIIKDDMECNLDMPLAYDPVGELSHYEINEVNNEQIRSCCFWCCYDIPNISYSMPCSYNHNTEIYSTYGHFCSLECISAYNFFVNRGSDKVWYINSLINMMAKSYGIHDRHIRPAPSRYLLEKFGGKLGIDEYRKVHQSSERSFVINVPPMISVQSSVEILNSSYIKKK
jgi:hypothetical protein